MVGSHDGVGPKGHSHLNKQKTQTTNGKKTRWRIKMVWRRWSENVKHNIFYVSLSHTHTHTLSVTAANRSVIEHICGEN